MADNLTPAQRKKTMSRVRSRETAMEVRLRAALHRAGFRFRKNDRRLPGTPDIYLPRYGAVIFINGCFWHGHPHCPRAALPTTRTAYWQAKVARNQERDRKAIAALKERGLRIATLWECGLRPTPTFNTAIEQIASWLCLGEGHLILPRPDKAD